MVTCAVSADNKPKRMGNFPAFLKKIFSFSSMLMSLIALTVFLAVPKGIDDPDIGWHLRNAEYQIHHRAFIHQDMYSFTTHGKPWMDYEWLSEIPYYLGWKWFGARGIYFVMLLALETILLGIFGLAFLESGNTKSAFLISFLAIFLATVSFGPRTLLFGWIFLVVELAILYSFQKGRDFTPLLPLVFLLWINSHGSWIIGLVLLAVFSLSGCIAGNWGLIEAKRWSGAQKRKLAWVSLLSTLALFVNPYGWRLVLYPFDMAFHQKLNIASIDEWRTVNFHEIRGKILLGIIAAAILLQLYRQRKWMLHEIAFLFIGLYAGLTYSRFLFLAAILVLPFLSRDISEWMPYYSEKDKPWLNAPIIICFLAVIFMHLPTNSQVESRGSSRYPYRALTYLQDFHPRGNVFNAFLWGGYLIWNTRQVPVFIDSRVDIYEHNGVFADYLHAVELKDSLRVLDKYSIRYALLERDAPLGYLLQNTNGWKVDYRDKTTILLERIDKK